jgi:HPt (histidine-containing phosphotransfer) domain-containing protein
MNNPTTTTNYFYFHPNLDAAFLNSVYQGDAENASYIFELYLAELPGTLASIREAMAKNDSGSLFEIVHKTKTSFSFVGLTHIAILMEVLEKAARDSADTSGLKDDVDNLVAEINQSTPLIEMEYARLSEHSKTGFETKVYHS